MGGGKERKRGEQRQESGEGGRERKVGWGREKNVGRYYVPYTVNL